MEPRRPEHISGYEHPSNSTYSRNGIYKTFTEGEKTKKNETFGNTSVGSQYATIANFTKDEENLCPKCNSPPTSICNCAYSDKKCSNGHIWYTARDGKSKLGNPHK